MNSKQKAFVQMIRDGMINIPKSNEDLAATIEKVLAIYPEGKDKKLVALSHGSSEALSLDSFSKKYLHRLANKSGEGMVFIYTSYVIDYLKRQTYTRKLNEIYTDKNLNLAEEVKNKLINDGLAEFAGKKARVTQRGLEVYKAHKEMSAEL